MSLPSHIAETVVTTRTFQCLVCQARVTPGIYARPGYGQQVLDEWLQRHAHPTAQQPNRRDQP